MLFGRPNPRIDSRLDRSFHSGRVSQGLGSVPVGWQTVSHRPARRRPSRAKQRALNISAPAEMALWWPGPWADLIYRLRYRGGKALLLPSPAGVRGVGSAPDAEMVGRCPGAAGDGRIQAGKGDACKRSLFTAFLAPGLPAAGSPKSTRKGQAGLLKDALGGRVTIQTLIFSRS